MAWVRVELLTGGEAEAPRGAGEERVEGPPLRVAVELRPVELVVAPECLALLGIFFIPEYEYPFQDALMMAALNAIVDGEGRLPRQARLHRAPHGAGHAPHGARARRARRGSAGPHCAGLHGRTARGGGRAGAVGPVRMLGALGAGPPRASRHRSCARSAPPSAAASLKRCSPVPPRARVRQRPRGRAIPAGRPGGGGRPGGRAGRDEARGRQMFYMMLTVETFDTRLTLASTSRPAGAAGRRARCSGRAAGVQPGADAVRPAVPRAVLGVRGGAPVALAHGRHAPRGVRLREPPGPLWPPAGQPRARRRRLPEARRRGTRALMQRDLCQDAPPGPPRQLRAQPCGARVAQALAAPLVCGPGGPHPRAGAPADAVA